MAYNANEKTVIIADIEKNSRGEVFRISRKIPEKEGALECIDVRLFYTPDDGDELRPTQKGVRFNSEHAVDMVEAIIKAMSPSEREELFERLDSDDADDGDDGDDE